LTRVRTRATAVRDRRLTAWAMARPQSSIEDNLIMNSQWCNAIIMAWIYIDKNIYIIFKWGYTMVLNS
jgi:hypothetical protein